MPNKLTYQCHEPQQEADACVIWLHGLGADSNDFASIVPQLPIAKDIACRFIFPDAPMRAVTINGGMCMRAWYDITNLDINQRPDLPGIDESIQSINQLIKEQISSGIASERIVLAGFSQGGVIALQSGLTFPEKLAGIIGLSTYLPMKNKSLLSENNTDTPILLAHGDFDPIVPKQLSEQANKFLTQQHYAVTYQCYPMAHQVCPEEINLIGHWLTNCLR